MKRIVRILAVGVLTSLVLVGCGGGGGDDGPQTGVGSVRGVVYAPDGVTPIADAAVYVPEDARSVRNVPPEAAVVSTSSNADGSFVLEGVPAGDTTIKIFKGEWLKSFQIAVTANQTVDAPAADTTLPSQGTGAAKIAVVTGSYDRMQDVLAKLMLGTIDSNGELVLGSEHFDLYDGDYSLASTYPEMSALLTDAAKLATYDIVFINCGADETLASDAQALSNIRSFVNNGGKLYVTDWAYNYVEQAFPDRIDFLGSDSTPTDQPEELNAAKVGEGGITVDATVTDATLKSWLSGRGALNADGTVRIEGFLGAWVVMNGAAGTVKTWVEGNVSYSSYSLAEYSVMTKAPGSRAIRSVSPTTRAAGLKPLTLTFTSGTGRVLYTSYHTSETASTSLSPQERILAYLVFEM